MASLVQKVSRSAVWPWMRELRGLNEVEEQRAEQWRDCGTAYDGIKRAWIVAEELVPFILDAPGAT